jgi:hypothetical protein
MNTRAKQVLAEKVRSWRRLHRGAWLVVGSDGRPVSMFPTRREALEACDESLGQEAVLAIYRWPRARENDDDELLIG